MDVSTVKASTAPRRCHMVAVVLVMVVAGYASAEGEGYYGKHLGKLKQLHHGVSGDVYAVDGRTLHIRDFTYDGEGPAAYFYVGSSKTPSGAGTRINDEKGTTGVLPRYRKQHITLTLPEGKTLNNIRWFSVWCDEFSVNFGDVRVPKGFAFPKPQKLETLKGIHGVSSESVVAVDAQTLLVPSFSYDGEAPDAKFWVGSGSKPNPQGIRIPDENGKKEHPLRRYDQKTIVLTLPGDMTVFDIGHFGVWCEAFAVDFGHVKIPKNMNVPPSLKMLGVSPQKRPRSLQLLPEQSRFQQLVPYPALQQHQQQQFFGNQADETRGDPNPHYQDPSTQFYRVTTYKPTYQLRNLPKTDNTFQIIPSIALPSTSNTFFGQSRNDAYEVVQPYQTQQTRNDEYEVIQPYQTQQSNVYARNDNIQTIDNNYRVAHAQPVYQQRYDGGNTNNRQQAGKSFSRVSMNGAGGHSNTYIQY